VFLHYKFIHQANSLRNIGRWQNQWNGRPAVRKGPATEMWTPFCIHKFDEKNELARFCLDRNDAMSQQCMERFE